jgi:hypothetical protein
MNDTTRQVGGALGVAVLGSVQSSAYASAIDPAVQALPAEAATIASDSIGRTLAVADRLGGAGQGLAQAANTAFIDSMGTAVWVAVGVALAGALVALLYLPARPLPAAVQPAEVERLRLFAAGLVLAYMAQQVQISRNSTHLVSAVARLDREEWPTASLHEAGTTIDERQRAQRVARQLLQPLAAQVLIAALDPAPASTEGLLP